MPRSFERNTSREELSKSRVLSDAKKLKKGAEFHQDLISGTAPRLEFTEKQVEAARQEMEQNKLIEKARKVSDAYTIDLRESGKDKIRIEDADNGYAYAWVDWIDKKAIERIQSELKALGFEFEVGPDDLPEMVKPGHFTRAWSRANAWSNDAAISGYSDEAHYKIPIRKIGKDTPEGIMLQGMRTNRGLNDDERRFFKTTQKVKYFDKEVPLWASVDGRLAFGEGTSTEKNGQGGGIAVFGDHWPNDDEDNNDPTLTEKQARLALQEVIKKLAKKAG